LIDKINSLKNNKGFIKYFKNTSWMMGEKVFTVILSMIVSIFVARYLGPEDFGILSYAISLSSLFGIATHMGLSGLSIRELVNNPDEHKEIMGTVFGIKFAAGFLAMTAFLVFIFVVGDKNEVEFWVLLIVSGTILLKPFEVIDFWFQSKVRAKYSSIVRAIGSISLSVIKFSLVILGAQLLTFAAAFLGQGWMIMLGAIFTIVYLKIDQVMIRWIINLEEVGVYSVAAKLSEAWYFFPTVIVSSLFPKLLELRKKDEVKFKARFQQLFDFLFTIALILAIVVTFIAESLINFLYGTDFGEAAVILSIHIWAGIFIFMRAAFSKWILVEDAIAFSMITQGSGALTNIVLNLIFIPLYGGIGAAIATILSYAMASYFSLFFYKKTRSVFWMMTRAFVSPFFYTYKLFKAKNDN
jgi:O-antigen/teichoic acid export membrane protein